ncbi:MAG TPA: hypothetical protein VMU06_09905 [Stellaceae bacterium]|nr:hypothetical protein [Stellaceae bacterium]
MKRTYGLKAGWLKEELRIAVSDYSRWPEEVRKAHAATRPRIERKNAPLQADANSEVSPQSKK